MLSRNEVRKGMRGPIAEVSVPEWGEGATIGIRRYSAVDLIAMRQLTKGIEDEGEEVDNKENAERNLDIACEVLSRGLCDENGKKMFTAEELHDWDSEQREVMYRLLGEVQSHNGIGEEAIEELEKNSGSGQTSGST